MAKTRAPSNTKGASSEDLLKETVFEVPDEFTRAISTLIVARAEIQIDGQWVTPKRPTGKYDPRFLDGWRCLRDIDSEIRRSLDQASNDIWQYILSLRAQSCRHQFSLEQEKKHLHDDVAEKILAEIEALSTEIKTLKAELSAQETALKAAPKDPTKRAYVKMLREKAFRLKTDAETAHNHFINHLEQVRVRKFPENFPPRVVEVTGIGTEVTSPAQRDCL